MEALKAELQPENDNLEQAFSDARFHVWVCGTQICVQDLLCDTLERLPNIDTALSYMRRASRRCKTAHVPRLYPTACGTLH